MNVFIARDGAVVGEYPHTEVTAMARRGELEEEDHYWHEGMEDWLPLAQFVGREAWESETAEPALAPGAPPPDRRVVLGGLAALVIVVAVVGFLVIKPDRNEIAATPAVPPLDAASALQLRDKAAADLRQRIERLPATAKPPLNTFYYDARVEMRPTFVPRAPWSATMSGRANVIQPGTDKTVSRTNFILTADYVGGEWFYKHYRATVTNVVEETSIEIDDDEDSPTPPSVVTMLGLKRREMPKASKVPGFK